MTSDAPPAVPAAAELDRQIDAYIVHLKVERGLSDNTLSAYSRDLCCFSEHVASLGRSDARDVSSDDLADWVRSLATSGRKASSQARMLVAVRGFYRHLRREGTVQTLPTEQVDLPRTAKRLPHPVANDTIHELMAAAGKDARDRAFVALLYGAGLRVSELVDLEMSQVHLDAGVLRVVGKGRKERIVPMGPPVVCALRSYLENDRRKWLRKNRTTDVVFPGRGQTGRVSRQTVFLRLRRLALSAGTATRVSPHGLRHGFATDLVRGGADLRSVQALLGHADLRTTEIYTEVDEKHLRRVYDLTHPRR